MACFLEIFFWTSFSVQYLVVDIFEIPIFSANISFQYRMHRYLTLNNYYWHLYFSIISHSSIVWSICPRIFLYNFLPGVWYSRCRGLGLYNTGREEPPTRLNICLMHGKPIILVRVWNIIHLALRTPSIDRPHFGSNEPFVPGILIKNNGPTYMPYMAGLVSLLQEK